MGGSIGPDDGWRVSKRLCNALYLWSLNGAVLRSVMRLDRIGFGGDTAFGAFTVVLGSCKFTRIKFSGILELERFLGSNLKMAYPIPPEFFLTSGGSIARTNQKRVVGNKD